MKTGTSASVFCNRKKVTISCVLPAIIPDKDGGDNSNTETNNFFFVRFLRSGVYLVLEKLELQVYQRLLKKM